MCILVSPMDHQVADIRNPGERVGEDEYGVSSVKQGITQEQQRSHQAQPPKGRGHDDAFMFFGGDPLHDEPREENNVS